MWWWSAVLISTVLCQVVHGAGMFKSVTSQLIPFNTVQKNYGVAVTNVGNGDGPMEWVVAGYSGPNLVLQYDKATGRYTNIAQRGTPYEVLMDAEGDAIGVCACDIDGDGLEEIYFLNTNDRYSGPKLVKDRLFKWRNGVYVDLFSDDWNKNVSSMFAGRSVACIDRTGSGKYGILVATYAETFRAYKKGSFGLIEMDEVHPINNIARGNIVLHDVALDAGIDFSTGGRGIVVGPIVGDDGFSDIYFVNEGNYQLRNRADNALFKNDGRGHFTNMAKEMNLDDDYPGRGVTLADFNNDGLIDIVYGNWMSPHKLLIQRIDSYGNSIFDNVATPTFEKSSPIRTVIAADFDNNGYLDVFMNNIVYGPHDASNKLYEIQPNGNSVTIVNENIGDAVEKTGYGTGASVADVDNDGVLELLIAHGESKAEGLSFYHVMKADSHNWIRFLPLTRYGAPARGAKVTVTLDGREGMKLTRIIDGGSGYLCAMEPVAHFGLGRNTARQVEITWPNGQRKTLTLSPSDVKKTHEVTISGRVTSKEPDSSPSSWHTGGVKHHSQSVGGSSVQARAPRVEYVNPTQARRRPSSRTNSEVPRRGRTEASSRPERRRTDRRDRVRGGRRRTRYRYNTTPAPQPPTTTTVKPTWRPAYPTSRYSYSSQSRGRYNYRRQGSTSRPTYYERSGTRTTSSPRGKENPPTSSRGESTLESSRRYDGERRSSSGHRQNQGSETPERLRSGSRHREQIRGSNSYRRVQTSSRQRSHTTRTKESPETSSSSRRYNTWTRTDSNPNPYDAYYRQHYAGSRGKSDSSRVSPYRYIPYHQSRASPSSSTDSRYRQRGYASSSAASTRPRYNPKTQAYGNTNSRREYAPTNPATSTNRHGQRTHTGQSPSTGSTSSRYDQRNYGNSHYNRRTDQQHSRVNQQVHHRGSQTNQAHHTGSRTTAHTGTKTTDRQTADRGGHSHHSHSGSNTRHNVQTDPHRRKQVTGTGESTAERHSTDSRYYRRGSRGSTSGRDPRLDPYRSRPSSTSTHTSSGWKEAAKQSPPSTNPSSYYGSRYHRKLQSSSTNPNTSRTRSNSWTYGRQRSAVDKSHNKSPSSSSHHNNRNYHTDHRNAGSSHTGATTRPRRREATASEYTPGQRYNDHRYNRANTDKESMRSRQG
ncbi:filaggrin isoform X1 [Aplysia californica]|uniref:Filaggrin isoform X1 n=1 Tax=Aplysia californica TaxID=6500 RepID=A0ABM0JPA1_APLCA|nr:filaggrin isoform X1 [Aplysia californica]